MSLKVFGHVGALAGWAIIGHPLMTQQKSTQNFKTHEFSALCRNNISFSYFGIGLIFIQLKNQKLENLPTDFNANFKVLIF